VKINIDRKRSSYIDKECFEISHNYRSTGDSKTDYLFILKALFSHKLSDVSFTNPTSTIRAAIAEPLITESNGQMRKRWCHDC
jgi:hypothetical protein